MWRPGCLPCCFGARDAAPGDVPRCELSSGSIVGEFVGSSEHFSAVPFAAPPVGPLRWKKPQPVESWVGDLDCSSHREDRRGRPVQSVDPMMIGHRRRTVFILTSGDPLVERRDSRYWCGSMEEGCFVVQRMILALRVNATPSRASFSYASTIASGLWASCVLMVVMPIVAFGIR